MIGCRSKNEEKKSKERRCSVGKTLMKEERASRGAKSKRVRRASLCVVDEVKEGRTRRDAE